MGTNKALKVGRRIAGVRCKRREENTKNDGVSGDSRQGDGDGESHQDWT